MSIKRQILVEKAQRLLLLFLDGKKVRVYVMIIISVVTCLILGNCYSLAIENKEGVVDEQLHKSSKFTDFYDDYISFVKALKENDLDVPKDMREKVLKYLETEKGEALIGFRPSRQEAKWHFYDLSFLRPTLILVSYEDGEISFSGFQDISSIRFG